MKLALLEEYKLFIIYILISNLIDTLDGYRYIRWKNSTSSKRV